MANIRINQLPELLNTASLSDNAFFALEQFLGDDNLSYKISAADLFTSSLDSSFNNTTVENTLIVQNEANLDSVVVPSGSLTLRSQTGEPSLNAFIGVDRGNQIDAQLLWNENEDTWEFTGNFPVKAQNFVNKTGVSFALSSVEVIAGDGLSIANGPTATLSDDFEIEVSDVIPKPLEFTNTTTFVSEGEGVVFDAETINNATARIYQSGTASLSSLRFDTSNSTNDVPFDFGAFDTSTESFIPWAEINPDGVFSRNIKIDDGGTIGSVTNPTAVTLDAQGNADFSQDVLATDFVVKGDGFVRGENDSAFRVSTSGEVTFVKNISQNENFSASIPTLNTDVITSESITLEDEGVVTSISPSLIDTPELSTVSLSSDSGSFAVSVSVDDGSDSTVITPNSLTGVGASFETFSASEKLTLMNSHNFVSFNEYAVFDFFASSFEGTPSGIDTEFSSNANHAGQLYYSTDDNEFVFRTSFNSGSSPVKWGDVFSVGESGVRFNGQEVAFQNDLDNIGSVQPDDDTIPRRDGNASVLGSVPSFGTIGPNVLINYEYANDTYAKSSDLNSLSSDVSDLENRIENVEGGGDVIGLPDNFSDDDGNIKADPGGILNMSSGTLIIPSA